MSETIEIVEEKKKSEKENFDYFTNCALVFVSLVIFFHEITVSIWAIIVGAKGIANYDVKDSCHGSLFEISVQGLVFGIFGIVVIMFVCATLLLDCFDKLFSRNFIPMMCCCFAFFGVMCLLCQFFLLVIMSLKFSNLSNCSAISFFNDLKSFITMLFASLAILLAFFFCGTPLIVFICFLPFQFFSKLLQNLFHSGYDIKNQK